MSENAARQFQSMAEGLISTGMVMREIAEEASLSVATVFRAIHGDSRKPSFETYTKLEILWKKRGKP
jgi:DNA-binding phage protein